MNDCRVLVMMSSYNGEKYIGHQIDSILNQVNCEITLRVRDDGSKDGTRNILNDYQARGKLTWYTGGNLMPAKSFMDLLANAEKTFDYYAFADQDDVWIRNKISAGIERLRNCTGPALYCSNAELVDDILNPLGQMVNQYEPIYSLAGIVTGGGIQGSTMIFNRKLAELFIGRSVPSFVTMHDYYVASVCSAVDGKIVYDEKSYMLYRQHGSNVLGIRKGILDTIKNRWEVVQNKNKIFNIPTTADTILNNYSNLIPLKNAKFLNNVKTYRYKPISRLKLFLKKGIGNGRVNIGVTIRLAILLGKL